MKKIILAAVILVALSYNSNAQPSQNRAPAGWHLGSFEKDGVYGAEVDNAYEFLNGKKPKKTVTVAIIGPGIDIGNDDIRPNLWVNRKDKRDGRDNDRNGLTDDVHGWNFLGMKEGGTLEEISRAGDREFFRLVDKYEHYFHFDGKFYIYDQAADRTIETTAPEDIAEYFYFREKVLPESSVGASLLGVTMTRMTNTYQNVFEDKMSELFPDVQTLGREQFIALPPYFEGDTLALTAITMTALGFDMNAGADWNTVKGYMRSIPDYQMSRYQASYDKLIMGERAAIGDDPYDIGDTSYGNGNLMAENAWQGTMAAGIIGAARGNGKGIDGIANKVKIMNLRVEADYYGEPYMKDMALAIRYAVDHGADIIQLGKTNTFYPAPWHRWVDDALLYAERKGVLVVIPMVDLSYDLDKVPFYPRKLIADGHELTNVLTVAASDAQGNPLMKANYSINELDIFAPGVNVTSTYTDNKTAELSSSYMAASVVSGIAALIKGYYPKATPRQIRTLLMDNITDRSGTEVEKSYQRIVGGQVKGEAKDLFLFEDLSVAPGIVNANRALRAAAAMFR